MPEYEGSVAFVDAVLTDDRAKPVLLRYPITSIPTSIFVDSNGEVTETYIGPLSAAELRTRLDALLAGGE